MEGIHNQTALKVNEIARNITSLEKELADKEGYLSLCQMRLANRAQRNGVELCQDSVQKSLMDELKALRFTVGSLNQMLTQVINPLCPFEFIQNIDISDLKFNILVFFSF